MAYRPFRCRAQLVGGFALRLFVVAIVELERRGLISRVPGQPRTIKVTLPDAAMGSWTL
jgi:hypothetical protein